MTTTGITQPEVERCELRPGYSISRVIKGGWQLAGGHGEFDRSQAIADMSQFVESGINTFDCADIYTGVESMIGDAITNMRNGNNPGIAEKVQIHTKLVPDLNQLDTLRHRDVEAVIDRSLRRLNVDQLHLVQFYWWDLSIGDPIASLEVLKKLQDKGKIKHIACTNFDEYTMQNFVENGFDLASAQVQYSLLDSRPAGQFSHWCKKHNLKILCYGVLAGGFLSNHWLGKADPGFEFENRSLIKYRLIIEDTGGWDRFQHLLSTLNTIATRHNVQLSTIATRYMLDQAEVAAVIIGARTARHLEQTLAVFSLSLSSADKQLIQQALSEAKALPGPVYGLERDRNGAHGRIMKYNLNNA